MSTVSRHEVLMWIAMLELPGVGEVTARRALSEGSVENAGTLVELLQSAHTPLSSMISADEIAAAQIRAERILEACDANDIVVLTLSDRLYPPLLRVDEKAPGVLYVRGDRGALNGTVGVVGARKASIQSQRTANRIGVRIAQLGRTLVSGGARGCDAEVISGCSQAGGRSAVVLPQGLLAPFHNPGLAQQALDKGGCIVSAYPPDAPPEKFRMVARNRVIAAMSRAVLVVETKLDGGSMHAARHAGSVLRRPVAVVGPRDPDADWPGENRQAFEQLRTIGRPPSVIHSGAELDLWITAISESARGAADE